jgi:tetratricopeptide (TPR) repeat protein
VLEKDYTKAIEYFSKALEADKQNFDAMFYRAISLLDSGLI